MNNSTNLRYWLCQLLGWGVWGLLTSYFGFVLLGDRFEQGGKKEFVVSLFIFLVCGFAVTHLLRTIIKKTNWLKYSFNNIIVFFVLAVTITSIALYYGGNAIEHNTPYSYDNFVLNQRLDKAKKIEADAGLDKIAYYIPNSPLKDSLQLKTIATIKKSTGWYKNAKGEWKHENKTDLFGIYQNLLLIGIWLLIYIVYHYVEKTRKDQVDRLKLESNIKELELKTIKSHINPHFIFNSLNSIRALVDEDPSRARTAITELSNILRSSMQAEKAETVSLEKELNIVKDYLALEQMRFEERLKIELEIDDDTLDQQVPPMMLQTLVENAIKHGISKQVNGGIVKVVTDFKADNLELLVQNTGQLNGKINSEGFGIKSTEDRLNLMYQGKATFSIRNLDNNMVESKVTMPVLA
jgi:two-component system, LytTR family, sensor kinase